MQFSPFFPMVSEATVAEPLFHKEDLCKISNVAGLFLFKCMMIICILKSNLIKRAKFILIIIFLRYSRLWEEQRVFRSQECVSVTM